MALSPYISQPLMLSSVERMAFYLQVDAGKGRVDGKNNDSLEQQATRRQLIQWATSISTSFEQYLGRQILIAERTEYFDTPAVGQKFFVRATPIREILEVQNDPTGQYQGSQWTLTANPDYFDAASGNYVQIWVPIIIPGPRTIRIRYIGGMAYHAVRSTFTLTGVTGQSYLVAGRSVYGNTSEATGRVISYTPGAGDTGEMVVEGVAGLFIAGEDLTFQTEPTAQDIPDCGAVLSDIPRPSVVQQFPDLDQALLIEARYMQKTQMSFENTSSGGPGGSTYRHTTGDRRPVLFQPETMAILNRYRRFIMSN